MEVHTHIHVDLSYGGYPVICGVHLLLSAISRARLHMLHMLVTTRAACRKLEKHTLLLAGHHKKNRLNMQGKERQTQSFRITILFFKRVLNMGDCVVFICTHGYTLH